MATMKAAVVPELGAKLEIREVTVPEPGAGQVLVKIEAAGLCHTDIHAAYGDWPVKPEPPFIPGHEGVGVVVKEGPGATLHKPGDRVDPVARIGVRALQVLRRGLGDAVRGASEQRLRR